ncbi:multiple sugar transport system ATP-binding protein [Streptomyces sp. SAI-135]|uniref:ABC transporter ATP-binding protein n=1 Tax=unclassified Streptomyces TaxID=2593676 RepID=UPI002473871A|nr:MULTISPECIES: sn-glycerol-3-phosphate ABC transporter ATP-binding protein UgpC [unclassified Streptomyces]MDH6514868.1 multiple sugar transport system ATP-binding protein [Streptomyces sp. SAI-090]MDH6547052.1 multiple sugar transport system ATP-binding protein [Streptomyces sp. SAI-041]MDH6588929.1 multiple sugar transport system ATP-binding protein [Streptomyces sp. SAI-133]MDH6621049.1 multiple sugar transport system ATP-binding protein [Streptomyces sp. SAI-135]
MASVTFDRATRCFPGMDRPAVRALELDISDGEFMVLVGPSGCGKSTSLRMLAGLEEVDSGTIRIGDRDVTRLPPKDRDIAMVFQNYALYPHMTAADNMGFALKIAKMRKSDIRGRVAEAAGILDLGDYLDRKPKSLSGGQRQRVAMGRAIVREPRVFLMDEPLSNLDAKLRVQTRTQIASLQRRLGTTTVYVTHDQVEALTMGDRVAVLKDGVLQQVGSPREVFRQPANAFVAGFIGSPAMNLFRLALTADGTALGDLPLALPRSVLAAVHEEGAPEIVLGVRPEQFTLLSTEDLETPALEVVIDAVEDTGAVTYLHTTAKVGQELAQVVVRAPGRGRWEKGSPLRIVPHGDDVHLFSAQTGLRLPDDGALPAGTDDRTPG